jgi:argininosuccinate lyase
LSKLWGGRFSKEPAPEMQAFTQSLSFDLRLAADDRAVLAAHCRALARAGLLSAADLRAVEAALDDLELRPEPGDEDVHSVVERALLQRLPEIAPRVRAGLSRNDRVAAALRRWLLREGAAVVALLADLVDTLAARAREHPDAVLPGYTHLQRAQPVRLAQHVLAHAFAFARDADRMLDALARADASPLGAGALAGSTLGLEHDPADAGFARAMPNSLDAVAARDFVAEFCAAAAICGVHLSRLGEEVVLWTSEEFGFAELSDAHATGSSLMPQKKNPDVFELARGKAGRLIGDLTGLLATLKGLPLAYNRDLQEDKEPLFDAVDTLRSMLPAVTVAMRDIAFDTENMARAAASGTLLATDLAEYLVQRGTPFKDAHEMVGRAVQAALGDGRSLAEVAAAEFGADVKDVLDARASVERRAAQSRAAAAAQLAELGDSVARIRARSAR